VDGALAGTTQGLFDSARLVVHASNANALTSAANFGTSKPLQALGASFFAGNVAAEGTGETLSEGVVACLSGSMEGRSILVRHHSTSCGKAES
jgi:hypothetical protein